MTQPRPLDGDRPVAAPAVPEDFSNNAHRRLIGYLGLLMPVLLYLLAGLRPTPALARWATLDSVSAYYYSGAVAVFVGVLFALALFLLTYRGYRGVLEDRLWGGFGGACAITVAVFPTEVPPDLSALPWWTPAAGVVHYAAAAALFGTFIVFSLRLFRKTSVPRGQELPRDKARRNRVYAVCGCVMIASILGAGVSSILHRPIFWFEVVALWAFAVSWLVKGEAQELVVRHVSAALDRWRARAGRRSVDSSAARQESARPR